VLNSWKIHGTGAVPEKPDQNLTSRAVVTRKAETGSSCSSFMTNPFFTQQRSVGEDRDPCLPLLRPVIGPMAFVSEAVAVMSLRPERSDGLKRREAQALMSASAVRFRPAPRGGRDFAKNRPVSVSVS